MQLNMVEQRLKRAVRDGVELRRLAGDLASEVFRARAGVLQRFRSLLAHDDGADAFAQGYRAALADVTAAVEQELQRQEEASRALALGRRERHRAVLTALDDGPRTSAELCARLRCDKGQMSRVLQELRGLELVEEHQRAGGDGRAWPQHLTLRGQHVLEQLGARRGGDAAEVLRHLPRVLDVLFGSGRIFLQDVARLVGGAPVAAHTPPEAASDALARGLFEAIGESHCVANKTWALYATPVNPATQEILHALDSQTRAPVAEELRRLLGGDVFVVVRADAGRDAWRRFLLEDRTLRGRTLESAELATGVPPPSDAFVIVYESEDLRRADIQRYREQIQAFEQQAAQRYYLCAPNAHAALRVGSEALQPRGGFVSLRPILEALS